MHVLYLKNRKKHNYNDIFSMTLSSVVIKYTKFDNKRMTNKEHKFKIRKNYVKFLFFFLFEICYNKHTPNTTVNSAY